jgi:pimeloyl-ACP methyl ester carboxylesterase
MARAMKFYRLWLEVARTGEGWERVAAAIPEVRDEKWYELVAPPPRDAFVWRWYQRVADYDSVRYWEKVQVPVLLVYGERDQTVPVAQSIARIDKALRKARNMDFTFIELPRAGHDLNVSRDPGQPFEWSRLAPGFADLMTAWILQRTRI